MGIFNNKTFQLGRFSYFYECEICKHPETQMEHDRESEVFLKEHYAIRSKNPLFFQCVHCKTGLIKPIGYAGEPSFIVECDESNDMGSDFQNLMSF